MGELGRTFFSLIHNFAIFLHHKRNTKQMKTKFLILLLLFPVLANSMTEGKGGDNQVPLHGVMRSNVSPHRSPSQKGHCPTIVYYNNETCLLTIDNASAESDATYEVYDLDENLQIQGVAPVGEIGKEDLSSLTGGTYLIYVKIEGKEYCGTIEV